MEKLALLAMCIEAVTGVIGGSMVLEQNHPYITLTVLATGAVATKITNYFGILPWNGVDNLSYPSLNLGKA